MPFDAQLDVVLEGEGALRGCRVWLAGSELRIGDRAIALDRLLGVARRGSVLLVVAEDAALAIRGEAAKLAPLAAELSGDAERLKRNVAAAEGVGGESPIFYTPAAVTGHVGADAVRGFALAVALRRGLVLVGRGASITVPWGHVREFDVKMGPFGPVARLGGDDVRLELAYLGDAQIQTLRRLCEERPAAPRAPSASPAAAHPPAPARRPTGGAPAVARREAEVRFRVPELSQALVGTASVEEQGLYQTARALSGPPLRPDFMEDHLREVRGVLAGPVAKRRREAAGSATLATAALALDGRALWNETAEALDAVAASVQRAFDTLVRRLAAERKLTHRQAARYVPSDEERAQFRKQLTRAVAPLQRICDALAEVSLRIRETAALGGEGLEALHDRWQEALAAFDRAYGQIWVHVGAAVLHWWEEGLWPRLRKLAQEKPRRGPFRFLGG